MESPLRQPETGRQDEERMPEDHIRYDILAQDALRGVIRKVLSEVAASGHLPGDHHFFVTFKTTAPGVRLSPHLKAKYAEQMTIVIQHQYWDLKVNETQFEIGLSFSDVPERLVIPFAAVRGFYDPSVNFELEFDPPGSEEQVDQGDETAIGAEGAVHGASGAGEPVEGADAEAAKAGADVVSLDSFRKKN